MTPRPSPAGSTAWRRSFASPSGSPKSIRWTGFGAAFTHLHTGLPADDTRIVLTAVLADATNLGLSRMADACTLATYRQLAWTSGWHLREETYRRALALVVNAQQRQPLAAHFGAADVSSSDGQHFPTGGPGEAVGAVNARYRRDASTLLYTHVSARHAPFHTVAILPSGEAAHVIDGLLYHEADLASSVHHTDGGGGRIQVVVATAVCADLSSSSKASAGVLHPSVLRGRSALRPRRQELPRCACSGQ